MLPARAFGSRKDRLSIDIVPELSIDTTFQCPHLHHLFEDTQSSDCYSYDLLETSSHQIQQHLIDDAIFGEVAEWLSLDERDTSWHTKRRHLQNVGYSLHRSSTFIDPKQWRASFTLAGVSLLKRQQLRASLVSTSTSTFASDVPEPELYFIALQLLASCFTLQPASSANNVPIIRQSGDSAPITALRLQMQYRFAPAAGHNARPPSETSPWPGLYNGPSIEEQLAELISRRRRRERNMDGACNETSSMISIHEHVKMTGWSDGSASNRDRRNVNASDDSSLEAKRGALSRLMCLLPTKQPKSPQVVNRLHKEPQGSKLRVQPRRSSLSNTAPWYRTSNTIKKIPSALRLRRAQSSPRRASTSPVLSKEAIDSRRNSSTPALGTLEPHPYPIPEIRRISASTQGYSQRLDLSARPTDPRTTQKWLDETRLSPFHTTGPNELLRASSTPLDDISPFHSTETLHPDLIQQGNGYFDYSLTRRTSSGIGGSGISEADEDREERDNTESVVDSEDSFDALYARGKRENTLSKRRSISPELIERLRRNGTPSSEGSGSTERQGL